MSNENNKPGDMQTLIGSVDFNVQTADGGNLLVKVRQLPIKDYPAFMAAQDDEIKMVSLLTGLTVEAVNHLNLDTIEEMVVAGEKLNSDFFSRWVQRRLARQERLIPGVTQKLMQAATSTSPSGSANAPVKQG